MNKKIYLDERASKEINKFPKSVRIHAQAYINILSKTGKLIEPYAKNSIANKIYMK